MSLNRGAIAGMVAVAAPMFIIEGFQAMRWSPDISYALALASMVGAAFVAIGMSGGTPREHDDARTLVPPELYDHSARAEAAFCVDEPGFKLTRLLATASAVTTRIAAGDLTALHPFISDGLYQRLSTQQRRGSLPSEFTVFATQRVMASIVTDYLIGPQYQSVQLRVTLGEADQAQTVALTFLRRRAARSNVAGLAEGKCPHCGAPLTLSATQRCTFCEAIVNSGAHDWVLVGLLAGVQTLARQVDVLDPENVRSLDPDLAAEELVDRATLTFWRWVEARQGGDGRLARVANAAFLEHLETTTLPQGVVTNGGAELRLLRSQESFVEAHVAMRWSDTVADMTRSHHTVFKLRRPRGQRTPAAIGLSTLRCQTCLAALTDAETPACEYCGASLQDAWCLFDLEPYQGWVDAIAGLRGELGADWVRVGALSHRERALALVVSVAKADGTVDDDELLRLAALAEKWQLPPGKVQEFVASTVQPVMPKLSRELAVSLMKELVAFAFIGDQLNPRERKRLDAIAARLGMESELSRSLARRTAELLAKRA